MFFAAALLGSALAVDASWEPLSFDWFYGTCSYAIADNALIETACPVAMATPVYDNYMSCLCANGNYTLSMYNCFVEAQARTGVSKKSISDSYKQFTDYCHQYGGTPIKYTEKQAEAYFAAHPNLLTWEEGNATMNGPFQPNWELLDDALLASGLESHAQYWYAELFGMIQTWYLFLIFFIQVILHWSAYVVPGLLKLIVNNPIARQIRRHVALPAIAGKSRSQPVKVMRWFLLCFPPRLHAVFFTGYLVLEFVFMCYHYHVALSPMWYDSKSGYIAAALAWRSGQLAMYKFPLVMLFAGRNNILIWLTGWQMEIFNHWHRWIARLLAIDVVIHSIAYSIDFAQEDYYTISFKEAYWNWGFVATFMVVFLCVNGTKSVRALCYEFFLYFHILMAVFSVVGTYWHIKTYKGFKNMWPVIAFWAFDRAVRLIRVVASGLNAKAHIVAHASETLEVTVTYSGWWQPQAGSYVFMHFLCSPWYAFQSHPFTIVNGDRKGEFKLFCRVHNGVTRKLYKRAVANGGTLQTRVLVEGPYGVEFATKLFKEIVLFAGGVGVTAVYSHAKHISQKSVDGQLIHVHWAVADNEPLHWFHDEIEHLAQLPNLHMTIYINDAAVPVDSDIKDGSLDESPEKEQQISETKSFDRVSIQKVNFAPDFNHIVSDHITNSQGSTCFFVCGPPAMTDIIRDSVAKNLLQSKNYVQYYEESFTM